MSYKMDQDNFVPDKVFSIKFKKMKLKSILM